MSPTPRIFTSADADAEALAGERVAVLGYGNLGRTFALNLRDSGAHPLVIGNRADEYATLAGDDGFPVLPIAPACAGADVILILLPDEIIPDVFAADIAPALQPGAAIVFASGYNLAYGLIEPPSTVDVLLLAPRMAGENARQKFLSGEGFYSYVSVEQEASGRAWQRLLGLAAAVGSLQRGALELDARREADLDLFVEQTVGPLIGTAIMIAFDVGVEAGIPPETLVLEMYMSGEMEMVFRSFREEGLFRASSVHGPTALYGGMLRNLELDRAAMRERFEAILGEIRSGEFARNFQAERAAGYPTLSLAHQMINSPNPISEAEDRVRTATAG